MTSRGPVITLAAVALLGLLLYGINLVQAPGSPSTTTESGATAAQSGAPAAESGVPATEPEATPEAAEPAASFPPQASYTGETEGNETDEAAVAVTVQGDEATAYVCDGKAVEAWYQGVAKDGTVELEGKGGDTLTGTLDGDTITGTISAQGESWTFTAEQARQPAGLYRSSNGSVTTGWIRQSDGSVTGLASNGKPAGPLDIATAQRVEGSF